MKQAISFIPFYPLRKAESSVWGFEYLHKLLVLSGRVGEQTITLYPLNLKYKSIHPYLLSLSLSFSLPPAFFSLPFSLLPFLSHFWLNNTLHTAKMIHFTWQKRMIEGQCSSSWHLSPSQRYLDAFSILLPCKAVCCFLHSQPLVLMPSFLLFLPIKILSCVPVTHTDFCVSA